MKAFLTLVLFLALVCVRAEEAPASAQIETLIKSVENSGCKFIRNGSEYSAKDAVQHMRRKYDHYRKEIKTPEDFIRKCATKSELSGKPYQVKLVSGETVACADWLRQKLKAMERIPPKAKTES